MAVMELEKRATLEPRVILVPQEAGALPETKELWALKVKLALLALKVPVVNKVYEVTLGLKGMLVILVLVAR